MSTSSSSSSSEDKKKKKKDKKKEKKKEKKKDKKKEKKEKGKKDKKEDKAARFEKKAIATEEWFCDRVEAVRLIGLLLSLDSGIAEELRPVFESLDKGNVVSLDGLQDKAAKKKLRHLLQALKLAPAEGQGFRTPSKKVCFEALFEESLAKARSRAAPAPSPDAAPAAAAAPEDASPGGADAEAATGSDPPAEASPAEPVRPRRVGPQLPGASVGASPGGESSEDEGPEEAAAGPRLDGEERKGVDLRNLPAASLRQEWMTTPHESIAAAFGPSGPSKADKFEVRRSKEEEEKFEKAYKERGPSLLEDQKNNKFAEHQEAQEEARKRKNTHNDMWGMSEREQGVAGAAAAASKTARRAFDPEQDLNVRKPMTGDQFDKLVENSVSGLAGRFSRGHVATSFL